MNNRLGITIRFNRKEQENLRTLAEFWQIDVKQVLKLAFDQLVVASSQINTKLKESDHVAKNYEDTDDSSTSPGGSDDADVGSGGNEPSNTDPGGVATAASGDSDPASDLRGEGSDPVGSEDDTN